MKTFIITFSKVGIRDGWVEVEAKDEEIARAWARREYGQVWSMIYAAEKWGANERALFLHGCIGHTVLYHENAAFV